MSDTYHWSPNRAKVAAITERLVVTRHDRFRAVVLVVGPVEAVRAEDRSVVVSALRTCVHYLALAEAPIAFGGVATIIGRGRGLFLWR